MPPDPDFVKQKKKLNLNKNKTPTPCYKKQKNPSYSAIQCLLNDRNLKPHKVIDH